MTYKELPVKTGTCCKCGQTKDVRLTSDPFKRDVYEIIEIDLWCEDCYFRACDDI